MTRSLFQPATAPRFPPHTASMTPSQTPVGIIYQALIQSNCHTYLGNDVDIEIVSQLESSGSWRVHVLKTEHGRRTAVLSEAAPSLQGAFEELHRKSAQAVDRFFGSNGFDLPPEASIVSPCGGCCRPKRRFEKDRLARRFPSEQHAEAMSAADFSSTSESENESESEAEMSGSDSENFQDGGHPGAVRGRKLCRGPYHTTKNRTEVHEAGGFDTTPIYRPVLIQPQPGVSIPQPPPPPPVVPKPLSDFHAPSWRKYNSPETTAMTTTICPSLPLPPPPPPPMPPSSGNIMTQRKTAQTPHSVSISPRIRIIPRPQKTKPQLLPNPSYSGNTNHSAVPLPLPQVPQKQQPQTLQKQQSRHGVMLCVRWIGHGEMTVLDECTMSLREVRTRVLQVLRTRGAEMKGVSARDLTPAVLNNLVVSIKTMQVGRETYLLNGGFHDDISAFLPKAPEFLRFEVELTSRNVTRHSMGQVGP